MWSYLIAVPFLGLLMILQSAIFSRIPLLEGQADLVLLALVGWALQSHVKGVWFWVLIGGGMAALTSAMPFGVFMAGYSLTAGLSLVLKRRVWKTPFLAMIASVFLGTLNSRYYFSDHGFITGRIPAVVGSVQFDRFTKPAAQPALVCAHVYFN